MADVLHTDLILPEHHQVANAVGAIAGSVMVDFTDGLHLLGTLDRLGVIQDQQALLASFLIQPRKHSPCGCLNHGPLIEGTAPEEFAVVGSMRTASQQVNQPLKGAAMADTNGQDQARLG